MELEVIAHIKSPMKEKFGLPRQGGLAPDLRGEIIFEKKYADMRAVEGLDGYDRIWLLWEFQDVYGNEGERIFRPRVRPPRLGGNTYVGVFATRSPFRPNPIGLSLVELRGIEETPDGPVLHIAGADLRDGTPIFDIKPYLPYSESFPGARGGFAQDVKDRFLKVVFGEKDEEGIVIPADLGPEDLDAIREILSQDPRPAYQDEPERVYGMNYAGHDIRFRVAFSEAIVTEIR